ncbi:MAG: hypothetical protein A3B70_02615 [Deltaproteobacteria bacterium RIFCSPHIGHO2_02_FULL_40_11]|nr:MAG: hypothetical protein A3B70_02615 [Deltaproteobacteria bacterium RIFCSPHIGHO2_02_FULL_40_11]
MEKKSVDIIFPVYFGNKNILGISIRRAIEIFDKKLHFLNWKIIIVLNGIYCHEIKQEVEQISKNFPAHIAYEYTPKAGKGWGVLLGWEKSVADVRAYMDIDLSTDPNGVDRLIMPILRNEADIVVGSRYHKDSKVHRFFIRRFVSKIYHRIFVKWVLGCSISDLQCGFKAINGKALKHILPFIKDREWFFESEMIYLASKFGFKIKEIPVQWTQGQNESGVQLHKVIPKFIYKTLELRWRKL